MLKFIIIITGDDIMCPSAQCQQLLTRQLLTEQHKHPTVIHRPVLI